MTKKQIINFSPRLRGKALAILICFLFSGCSPSHILHYKEEVSRDYTYIDFSRNPAPFQVTSNVGGEHTRYIKILGFEGDKFIVKLTPAQGNVMCSISGEGFDTRQNHDGIKTVLVRDVETIISIDLSAHPYGEYTLDINKL